jgi:hypothetical protein
LLYPVGRPIPSHYRFHHLGDNKNLSARTERAPRP